jgi:hypothetical protein
MHELIRRLFEVAARGLDAYDTRKQLWRIGVHPMMQFYDAKIPWYRANIWFDLNNGSYYLANLDR